VTRLDNIHTDADLVEFMAKQMTIRIPQDTVQWGYFLIPDFKDGQGILLFKAHHSFSDGVGIGQFFMGIQDEYDPKSAPGLKTVPFWKTAMVYILAPFLFLKSAYVNFATPRRLNFLNNNKPFTGRKNGAATQALNLAKIKTLAKQLGCTHNDFMTALLSQALHEYLKEKGDKSTSVDMAIPFSMKQPGAKAKDIRLDNDMVGLHTSIKLFDDFDEGLKHFKKQFKIMKSSLAPFGVMFLALFAQCFIPLGLNKYAVDMAMEKYSLVFSNAFLSKKPMVYGGTKQHQDLGCYFFSSVPGKCYATFTLLTIGETMGVGCYSDEKVIPDPQRLMDIFVKKYDDVIKRLK